VEERRQVQVIDRMQPILPMMPEVPEGRTRDDSSHDTTTLFVTFK
jgi:hypothetical protein